MQAIQLFLSIFISLSLIIIFNEKKNEEIFTVTFLFFLVIFSVFYLGLHIVGLPEHLNSDDVLLYFNSFFAHEAQLIQGEPAIRVTGLGRSLLIISLIFFTIYLSFKKKIKFNFFTIVNIHKYIYYLYRIKICNLLSSFYILNFICIFRWKLFKKIKYFLIFLILPILLFFISANILKEIQLDKKLKSFDFNSDNLDLEDLDLEDIEKIENNELKKF